MGETAYSVASGIMSYIFILIMALVIINVSLRSAMGYRSLVKKKRKAMELIGAGCFITLIEPREHDGERFTLYDENFIGRAADDDICITDARMKKHHAVISVVDGCAYISSKRRRNVYINDYQNTEKKIRLRDGDEVAIERLCFVFRETGAEHE